MNIQLADKTDVEALMVLGEKYTEKSPYGKDDYSPEQAKANLVKAIEGSDSEIIVLVAKDQEGNIEGFLVGAVVIPLFQDTKKGVEMMFCVSEDIKNPLSVPTLIRAFEYWAKTVGCNGVQFSSIDDRFSKFLKRSMKYHSVETAHFKEI